MQTSGSWHASRASESSRPACRCSAQDQSGLPPRAVRVLPPAAHIEGGSDEVALPRPVSATFDRASSSLASFRTGSGVLNAVAWGASTCSARAVADVARLTSIGAPVLSRLGKPRAPAAAQPARAIVPHNPATTASRCELFTLRLRLKAPREPCAKASSIWSREEEKL